VVCKRQNEKDRLSESSNTSCIEQTIGVMFLRSVPPIDVCLELAIHFD
jgi:hypothetical protein